MLEEKLGRLAWILLKTCAKVEDQVIVFFVNMFLFEDGFKGGSLEVFLCITMCMCMCMGMGMGMGMCMCMCMCMCMRMCTLCLSICRDGVTGLEFIFLVFFFAGMSFVD